MKIPQSRGRNICQFKIITSNKLSCVLTHLKPSPYCEKKCPIIQHFVINIQPQIAANQTVSLHRGVSICYTKHNED